jgi:hypothetical protein
MNQLQVIEHQNQRVLTTAQLAEAYGTDEKRISENYTRNQERYTEGKHYFYLEGDGVREFLQSANCGIQNISKIRTLYLWTEKGAWLHAKSLNTDRAWEAYEALVDDYYRIKQQLPATLEDLIILQAKSVKELKNRVALIEEKATAAHHRIDNIDALDTIGDHQQRLNAMIRRLAHQEGLSFSGAWKSFRGAFNLAFRTNITMLVENYRMRHNLGKITVPQYLSLTGKLEDGIRVADKLLNRAS